MANFIALAAIWVESTFQAHSVWLFQEYVDYNGGAGVQHIAMRTNDIITAVCADLFVTFSVPSYGMWKSQNSHKFFYSSALEIQTQISPVHVCLLPVEFLGSSALCVKCRHWCFLSVLVVLWLLQEGGREKERDRDRECWERETKWGGREYVCETQGGAERLAQKNFPVHKFFFFFFK